MFQYQSTKPYPYVYKGINRLTGQIYIGYRERNVFFKLSSTDDLGKTYFTSSPKIKAVFNDFDWTILAEFFDDDSAYDYEQSLINDLWNNPLLLNKSVKYKSKRRFKCTGHSPETRKKLSKAGSGEGNPNYGKIPTEETRRKIGDKNKGNLHSLETKQLISSKVSGENHPNFGKHLSEETKKKISEARKSYYERLKNGRV